MKQYEVIGERLRPVLYDGIVNNYPLSSVYTRRIYGDVAQHFLLFNSQNYKDPKKRQDGPQIVAVLCVDPWRVVVKEGLTGAEERRVKEFIYQYAGPESYLNDPGEWGKSDRWINNGFVYCRDCQRIVSTMNVQNVDGVPVCGHCLRENDYEYCYSCGSYHKKENMMAFSISNFRGEKTKKRTCKACYEHLLCNYVICETCGDLIPPVCVIKENGKNICVNCSNVYDICASCGARTKKLDIFEIDGALICTACEAQKRERKTIRTGGESDPLFYDNDRVLSYHYDGSTWERRFYCSKGYTLDPLSLKGPYMGVEYEIESEDPENTREYVENVLKFADGLGHFERDGSLEYGAEFVMEPMTLQYARKSPEVVGLLMEAESYMFSDSGTGLHVHVARDFFGDRENQLKSIGILAYWLSRFDDDFFRISRRPAMRGSYYSDKEFKLYADSTQNELEERLESYDDGDRYKNLNLNNTYTIEFRFFGSTTSHNEFIKTLEVIDTICRKANAYTISRACMVRDFSELLDRSEFKGGM